MKEIFISIAIIISIFIANKITDNYTTYSVEETSKTLHALRQEIKENKENKQLQEKINQIHEEWDKKYEKLAYYIEHNELEKVETNLTILKGYIEVEEYSDSIAKLDETIYILTHIEDKNKFNLKNIF